MNPSHAINQINNSRNKKNPHLVVLDLQWRLVCHPTTPYDGGGLPA
jgi:hypothetical protein